MKKVFLFTSLAVLLAWTVLPETAKAFSRAAEPLSVAIAQADAIVVARTTRVPEGPARYEGGTADIEVRQVLKGAAVKGPLTVQLDQVHSMALGPLKPDAQYLFFLRAAGGPQAGLKVMLDGTCLHSDEEADKIRAMIAITPAWSSTKGGLSTCLVADPYRSRKGEDLNLYVVCRNLSDRKMTFTYSDWPLASHTFWELGIELEGGAGVPPSKHPALTLENINEYFGKFHRTYDITLEPDQDSFFPIRRISTAKPGWGYKEDLDFKYYPMVQPGCYHVTARARNFSGEIEAGGLRVWVE